MEENQRKFDNGLSGNEWADQDGVSEPLLYSRMPYDHFGTKKAPEGEPTASADPTLDNDREFPTEEEEL